MNVIQTFEEKVQSWVSLDNQIRLLNDKARELRNQRSQTEETILEYVETQNLSNATVKISDGKLRFIATKQTSPLTFKHVEDCLHKCIQNDQQVEQIINFIRESRETKYTPDIKRTYDN